MLRLLLRLSRFLKKNKPGRVFCVFLAFFRSSFVVRALGLGSGVGGWAMKATTARRRRPWCGPWEPVRWTGEPDVDASQGRWEGPLTADPTAFLLAYNLC